jgi:hypothetical protein
MNDKTLSIIIKAQDQASRTMATVGDRAGEMGRKVAGAAALAAKATGIALVAGIGAAAKASWDQVGAVQQATVALNAYEKDAGKVDNVLKSLVKYAQSDMGVLFNRKDLFESAQSLKIMGDTTENLSSHVQILSRSVGLGLSNWTDLNQIVGRVGSTGRLTGDDFDNLTKAGYRLEPSLRNTNITFDQLFQALDKGIPTDALAGQANTIQGLGIRFQTAFRGIGNAILGVDSETNKFVEGGIGDRLTNTLNNITQAMKTPDVKNFFMSIAEGVSGAVSGAISAFTSIWNVLANMLGPSLAALWHTLSDNVFPAFERFIPFLQFGAQVLGGIIVAAVWLLINVLNVLASTLSWIGQVVANVGQWFVDRWNNIVSLWSQAPGFFRGIGSAISSAFSGITNFITAPFRAAYDFVSTLPQKMVSLFAGVGGMIRSAIGNIDIPGPLGRIRDVIPGFASGTNYAPGGMAVVGERGPELVNLPRGSQVVPNDKLGGATFNMYGNVNLGSSDAVDRFFERLNAQKEMGAYGVGI